MLELLAQSQSRRYRQVLHSPLYFVPSARRPNYKGHHDWCWVGHCAIPFVLARTRHCTHTHGKGLQTHDRGCRAIGAVKRVYKGTIFGGSPNPPTYKDPNCQTNIAIRSLRVAPFYEGGGRGLRNPWNRSAAKFCWTWTSVQHMSLDTDLLCTTFPYFEYS